jgi:hypothetical protein
MTDEIFSWETLRVWMLEKPACPRGPLRNPTRSRLEGA